MRNAQEKAALGEAALGNVRTDNISRFKEELLRNGITPPSLIADDNIHRCDTTGENGKNDASYLLHLYGIPTGSASSNWVASFENISRLTPQQRDALCTLATGGTNMATIIRLPTVKARTGLSRSTIYLRITQGLWTKSVSLGPRAVGWPSGDVAAINAARIAGKTNDEIRALVVKLEAARKAAA